MTSEKDFDRLLTAWLVDAAPQREPDGLLPRTMVHVRRSRREPAWLVSLRGNALGRRSAPASRVVALALLALLALAVLGAALIGSLGRPPVAPPTTPPSAIWAASLPQVFGLPGRFAFSSDRDGDLDIYTMNPDRTHVVQLTNEPGDDVAPLWSPDGRRIAFATDRNGDIDIYLVDADGTGLVRLTSGVGDERLGAWSPDGMQIAYATDEGVRLVDADGGNDRVVVPSARLQVDFDVHGWWPGGDELLMVIDRTGEGGEIDIYRVRIADGLQTQLTSTRGDDGTPVLSPDGSRIAFQSDRDGGCLYVMDADGSRQTRLTTGCAKGFPKAWAPDGTLIGWAGARRPDFDQPFDIQVIRPDGSGMTRLTDGNDVVDLAWGPSP